MRTTMLVGLMVCVAPLTASAESAPNWMIRLMLHGQEVEGRPLRWDERQVNLLGRDGRLWQFAPEEAADYRKTSDRFQPYSASELRARLLRELGQEFEVTATSHYVVAHAKGQRDQWAARFEELYRSFVHYFLVRGFRLSDPPVPLVGVVCRNRADFVRYAARQGAPAGGGILGYYCLESNRIVLYDAGDSGAGDWQQTASVLLHEATHQTAFNTGVHSRCADPPVWVAEGLATMFEAPGVYDSRRYPQRSQRINRERFEEFRSAVAPRHRPQLLADLVATDNFFRAAPSAAYAEAWALTFYLVETQPRKYADYLARTARRAPFSADSSAQRTADFTAVFGADWRMLEAQLLRFMAGLK